MPDKNKITFVVTSGLSGAGSASAISVDSSVYPLGGSFQDEMESQIGEPILSRLKQQLSAIDTDPVMQSMTARFAKTKAPMTWDGFAAQWLSSGIAAHTDLEDKYALHVVYTLRGRMSGADSRKVQLNYQTSIGPKRVS